MAVSMRRFSTTPTSWVGTLLQYSRSFHSATHSGSNRRLPYPPTSTQLAPPEPAYLPTYLLDTRDGIVWPGVEFLVTLLQLVQVGTQQLAHQHKMLAVIKEVVHAQQMVRVVWVSLVNVLQQLDLIQALVEEVLVVLFSCGVEQRWNTRQWFLKSRVGRQTTLQTGVDEMRGPRQLLNNC